MVANILKSLEKSTPALRQRYLARIRQVPNAEAREIEARLIDLIARDKMAQAS